MGETWQPSNLHGGLSKSIPRRPWECHLHVCVDACTLACTSATRLSCFARECGSAHGIWPVYATCWCAPPSSPGKDHGLYTATRSVHTYDKATGRHSEQAWNCGRRERMSEAVCKCIAVVVQGAYVLSHRI